MIDKGTAYSAPGFYICDNVNSVDEVKAGIKYLVNKHPVLKARVCEFNGDFLLVTDSTPCIEVIEYTGEDYELLINDLIAPFDFNESLCRFWIINDSDNLVVFYDMHHLISDATSRTIINSELKACFHGDFDDSLDLGFLYDADNSFTNKFKPNYDKSYNFFMDQFSEIDTVVGLIDDVDGEYGSVTLPVRGIRNKVESFVQSKSITVGVLLNAVFAYTYSRFTGNKIYFTFTEHGRHDSYNEKALGMYVRTIPVIVDCVDVSVEEYIGKVSDIVLNSILYSDYPFRFLARDFGLTNDVSFEYNFNLNDVSRVDDDLICSEDTLGLVSNWQCVVNDLEDGFVVSVSHNDKYSQSTAIRFVANFFRFAMFLYANSFI